MTQVATKYSLQEIANKSFDEGSNSVLQSSNRRISRVVEFGSADGDGKFEAAPAVLSTALTGSNNDIDYTAAANGKDGNDITVAYVDPGTPGAALSVVVIGDAIIVNLATAANAAAALSTNLTGSNNDLDFTARTVGEDGNDITIAYVDPGEGAHATTVDVNGTDIVVSLGTTSPGTAATGTITSDTTNVSDGDTVTIGTQVYRFKNTLAAANDVKIAATAALSLANLKKAINLSGTPGTDYHGNTLRNTKVTAGTLTSTTLAVTAITTGSASNSVATTETSSHLSWGASTLASGADTISATATQVKNAIDGDAEASALVSVALKSGNTGAGVVTTLTATHLAGGAGGAITTTGDNITAAILASAPATALVSAADKSANDGSGVVTAMAATHLAGGADGFTTVFRVDGAALVAIEQVCAESLVGDTATLETGVSGNTAGLIGQELATDVDFGEILDKTGLLADPADVNRIPTSLVVDNEIIITPDTADISDGKLYVICHYTPLDADTTVTAV